MTGRFDVDGVADATAVGTQGDPARRVNHSTHAAKRLDANLGVQQVADDPLDRRITRFHRGRSTRQTAHEVTRAREAACNVAPHKSAGAGHQYRPLGRVGIVSVPVGRGRLVRCVGNRRRRYR